MEAPVGSFFHPGRATGRADRAHDVPVQVYAADPPPFGVGSRRFSKHDSSNPGQEGPDYHVAYNSITSPPRWDTKGWQGLDDPIKRGRGTSTGKVFSAMAQPTGPPPSGSGLQPMFATYPNETRLQELLDLQRRKTQGVPAPGTYDLPGWQSGRVTFRRPLPWDGPVFNEGPSTRVKEIAARIMAHVHSDVGPGEYDPGSSKEATSLLRNAPAVKIGSGAREGRTKHVHTLSISRSLQHGIDWHVPVIVQAKAVAAKQPQVQQPDQQQQQQQHFPMQPEASTAQAGEGDAPQHTAPKSPTHTTHKYREPSPPKQTLPGQPPAPPPHVARTRSKQTLHRPGDWNWETLKYNYRTSWTTLHGGAYQHGERQPANLRAAAQAQHARHTAAAAAPHDTPTVPEEASPPVQHAAPPQDATPSGTPGVEALFGPNTSSLDLSSIPADGYAMFPVPEESSAMYREIEGSPQAGMTRDSLDTSGSRLGSSQQGLGGARWPHAGLRVQPPGTANTSSPSTSSPRRGLTSAQDLVRHQQAMQAAVAVHQVNVRQREWLERSGERASPSQAMPTPTTTA